MLKINPVNVGNSVAKVAKIGGATLLGGVTLQSIDKFERSNLEDVSSSKNLNGQSMQGGDIPGHLKEEKTIFVENGIDPLEKLYYLFHGSYPKDVIDRSIIISTQYDGTRENLDEKLAEVDISNGEFKTYTDYASPSIYQDEVNPILSLASKIIHSIEYILN